MFPTAEVMFTLLENVFNNYQTIASWVGFLNGSTHEV